MMMQDANADGSATAQLQILSWPLGQISQKKNEMCICMHVLMHNAPQS